MYARLLYRNFHFILRGERWLHQHTSQTGRLLLGLALVAFMFGIDPRRTLSFQLFAVCCAAILVGIIASQRFRPSFSARRHLPSYATVGQLFSYHIVVRNLGDKNQLGLQLRDEPSVRAPSLKEFVHGKEPHGEKRNWFDRKVGYPRWLYLNAMLRGADTAIADDIDLPPREELRVTMQLTPKRRGRLRLATTTLARPDPLGLFFAECRIGNPNDIVVLPRRHPVPAIRLPGVRANRSRGELAASKTGHAETFVSLREYRPGDPPRHIHWKSWARLRQPVIKEFQDQHEPHYALVLDNFAPTRCDPKTEAAIEVAASLVSPKDARRGNIDRIVLVCDADPSLPRPAPEHVLLEKLAIVENSDSPRLDRIERNIVRECDSVSGVICIFRQVRDEHHRFIVKLTSIGIPALAVVIIEEGEPTSSTPRESDLPIHEIRIGEESAGLALLAAKLHVF